MAADESEAKLARVERQLGEIHHDFNNVTTVLLLSVEALQDSPDLTDADAEELATMEEALTRALQMSAQLANLVQSLR